MTSVEIRQSVGADAEREMATSIENHQLAGLLHAVSTAAGQEATRDVTTNALPAARSKRHTRQSQSEKHSNGEIGSFTSGQEGENLPLCSYTPSTSLRNKHDLYDNQGPNPEPESSRQAPSRKRKRKASDGDAPAVEQNVHDQPLNLQDSTLEIRELPTQIAINDARAAGVHSAAALFRRPSASSKKYTRPPMSKLFASLELSPESFLHLQAAAKSYMLDSNHPERQACVGNRGKGDTDMVKLRLYNCVREFLENEGHGEACFGVHVEHEGLPTRTLVWPAQKNRIISLVTPLLRRMVTNERQRQYAMETRKAPNSASKNKKTEGQSPSSLCQAYDIDIYQNMDRTPFPGSANMFENQPDQEFAASSLGGAYQNSPEEPEAKRQKRNVQASYHGHNMQTQTPPETDSSTGEGNTPDIVKLQISTLQGGQRLHPRLEVPSTAYHDYASLAANFLPPTDTASDGMDGAGKPRIECLLETGLVEISNQNEYASALSTVKQTVWMENELKIIVSLP